MSKQNAHTLRVFLLLIASVSMVSLQTPSAEAQTYAVIHNFNGLDGGAPDAGVVEDAAGNLYGTAFGGVGTHCLSHGCGVIYEMTPSNGAWTEQVIYQFQGTDGEFVYSQAALDPNGNVFATASECTSGCDGTVVEASPHDGGWTGTVLHRFTGSPDGSAPTGGLVGDNEGTLYGTTATGGLFDAGTVFALSGAGYSNYARIFSFTGQVNIVAESFPAFETLARDAEGNLYGTTQGNVTLATIFEMSPNGLGGWTEKHLYRFTNPQQGTDPSNGVVLGPDGNLYGVTYSNGAYGYGVVYELARNSDGTWSYNVIHAFQGGADGGFPSGAPAFDAAGNLYGTTEWEGSGGYGTVFKMTPSTQGQWTKTILHNFTSSPDGANPQDSKLWIDRAGNIYGTTIEGGVNGEGTVFEITP